MSKQNLKQNDLHVLQSLKTALDSNDIEHMDTLFDKMLQMKIEESMFPHIVEMAQVMGDTGFHLSRITELPDYYQNLLSKVDDDMDRAAVLHELGNITIRLGEYGKAEDILKESLDLRIPITPNEASEEIASTLNSLGTLNFAQGRHDISKAYLLRSLDMLVQIQGKGTSIKQASTHAMLGNIYVDHGDYNEANRHFSETLHICSITEQNQEVLHALVGALVGKGNIAAYQVFLKEALTFFEKALNITEKLYPDAPHILKSQILGNLGNVYDDLGEFLKSSQYYELSLNMKKEIFKTDQHPFILPILLSITSLQKSMGRLSLAKDYALRALDLSYKLYGTDPHLDTIVVHSALGGIYEELGDYKLSKKYFQKGLDLALQFPGGGVRYEVGIMHNNLGSVFLNLGEPLEAIEHFKAAMHSFAPDGQHPEIAAAYKGQSEAKHNLGDLQGALFDVQQALNQLNTFYSDVPHFDKLEVYERLNEAQYALEDTEGAVHSALEYLRNHLWLLPTFSALASPQEQYNLNRKSEKVLARLFQVLSSAQDMHAEREQALEYWFKFKGNSLTSDTLLRLLIETHPKLQNLYDDWQSARLRLARVHTMKVSDTESDAGEDSTDSETAQETIQKAIQEAEQEFNKAEQLLRQQAPRLFELQKISPKDVREFLGKQQCYLDFAAIDGQVYVFMIRGHDHKTTLLHCGSTDDIFSDIQELREQLSVHGDHEKKRPLGLDVFCTPESLTSKLYDVLIRQLPLSPKESEELIISPDGELHFLPFDMLYDTEKQQFMVEQYYIRMIPFIRDLLYTSSANYDDSQGISQSISQDTSLSRPILMGYPDFKATADDIDEAVELDTLQLVKDRLQNKEALIQLQKATLHGQEQISGVALWRSGQGMHALDSVALPIKDWENIAQQSHEKTLIERLYPHLDSFGLEKFTFICPDALGWSVSEHTEHNADNADNADNANDATKSVRFFSTLQNWWETTTPAQLSAQSSAQSPDHADTTPAPTTPEVSWKQLMSLLGEVPTEQKGPNEEVESLPATFTQVVKIAELLGQFRPCTYLGAAASVATLRHALEKTGQPSVLHLTTHGTHLLPTNTESRDDHDDHASTESEPPRQSPLHRVVLLLAGANERGSEGFRQGQLSAFEFGSFNLQGTALVNLAACETALGEAPLWEGVQGFVSAAFLAGAKATLTTLWSVESRSTERFMTDFYRLWAKTEQARARPDVICTQIKRQRVQSGAMPFYWAGFTVHSR